MWFIRFFLTLLVLSLPPAVLAQTLGTVHFDFDSDVLSAEERSRVEAMAAQIRQSSGYKPTVVVGYTDAVGASGYNLDLGQRRARTVANVLIANGVPVSRIGAVESRGENDLVVVVTTPERANRRVEVSLAAILAACRSYRDITLAASAVGSELQADLRARLTTAVQSYDALERNGSNGPAFQMAGAARHDCNAAVGHSDSSIRKLEYARRCLCSSARLETALGRVIR
ncbi:OmpA family protein [Pseudoruegeria sp. HB172150]|uniref:OmpA family protein n=1 Tax=Pseudoruegeria sp. HB172150 TaxID=2721164 RepID=UPI00155741A4|nr:OmpA family protein [Pseudoruegeria sp. HB172150]